MIKYNNDYQYANEKLSDSYVLLNGEIVLVLEVRASGEVWVRDCSGNTKGGITLNDLNLEPPKLGYVNLDRYSGYVSRVPARHWRQGFRKNTLSMRNSRGNVGMFTINKSFNNCIRNQFPTLGQCLEVVVNQEKLSQAFSRIFSVASYKDSFVLEYKAKKVGEIDVRKDEVTLDNKFLFLEDVLKPCL